MDAKWFPGISSPEQKEQRKKTLKGYKRAFTELEVILSSRMKATAVRDYDVPGWNERQIARNEYNACLQDIIKLIKID